MTSLSGSARSVRSADTLTRDALTVLQPGFTGTTAPDWLRRRLGEGLAAVGLFGRNVHDPEQLAALTRQLRRERDDVLVAIDEEGGDVTRLEVRGGSSFPGNHALGAVDDTALTRQVARELGRRLAGCGINLNWAPSADVNSNPANPVIGVRSFGADPHLVARHTAAYVEGLQSAGVAACTKHFPGHGDTAVDSHHDLPRITADLATLQDRELVPFRAAVAAGTRAVMSAHILLPALDGDRPATLSPAALHGLLRAPATEGGLGFDGLIVTDGMEMQAISAIYGIEHGSVLAIAAGADAICVGGGLADEATVLRLRDALVRAVRTGELPEERLADAAARVRALARWTRGAGAGEGAAPALGIGLTAARRALRITTGDRPYEPLTTPAYVAAFTPLANIAVGDETPWGVAAELSCLVPGTATATYPATAPTGTGSQVDGLLTAAGDRRIVAVVRDVHRHPWMADTLRALLAARPDTAVVEMGVPQSAPQGALHIATHGAARVCGQAAAEALTTRTPPGAG
ncbi:putative beta-N-acetylhexosaminidase [Streptomyces sp. NBRC 110611]|uniref:glycoside hydrolase family 3 protein n=1 Tax=Streptomyces sp. NBRC 110611 TaxID=1621259 RepID=UPI000831D7BE|nr:glycoside hydrolase family 3 protein [Streptomyces sp. NBRC 110611]GAU65383.1 putative beta-N-acetylhexosaminidase [Streptomyces sp. NBRC 110611]